MLLHDQYICAHVIRANKHTHRSTRSTTILMSIYTKHRYASVCTVNERAGECMLNIRVDISTRSTIVRTINAINIGVGASTRSIPVRICLHDQWACASINMLDICAHLSAHTISVRQNEGHAHLSISIYFGVNECGSDDIEEVRRASTTVLLYLHNQHLC